MLWFINVRCIVLLILISFILFSYFSSFQILIVNLYHCNNWIPRRKSGLTPTCMIAYNVSITLWVIPLFLEDFHSCISSFNYLVQIEKKIIVSKQVDYLRINLQLYLLEAGQSSITVIEIVLQLYQFSLCQLCLIMILLWILYKKNYQYVEVC